MSFPLFREPEYTPLNPIYSTKFSLFAHASISPLYEIIDTSPAYHMAWSSDGSTLYCASNQTLHHVKFSPKTLNSTDVPSLTHQLASNFNIPLPPSAQEKSLSKDPQPLSHFITPCLVRVADSQIVKIIPCPDFPNKVAIISLDDKVRIIEFISTSKRTDFKITHTFICPLLPQSQQPSSLNQTAPLIPTQLQSHRVPIDAHFSKSSTQLVIVDNLNTASYWDLLHPSSPFRIATLQNNLKMFGQMPPIYPELLRQLYPAAVLMKSNPGVVNDSGTQAQLGKTNNAEVYSSQKYSPITSFHINNLLDDYLFVTTGHGDVMWVEQKNFTPFLQKKVASNCAINVSATSTQFLSPHVRDMVSEYHQLQAQLRQTNQAGAAAGSAAGKQQHQQNSHPRTSLDATKSTTALATAQFDEKAIQLHNQRTNLQNVLSQLQHEQTVALGMNDGLVFILSSIDFSLLHTIQIHDNPIISLSYSPDGAFLATISMKTKDVSEIENGNLSSLSCLLCIIHVETGHVVYQRQNHGVTSFTWNPNYPVASFTSLITSKETTARSTTTTEYISQLAVLDFSATLLTTNIPSQNAASILTLCDDLFPPFPPPALLAPVPNLTNLLHQTRQQKTQTRTQHTFGITPLPPAHPLHSLTYSIQTLKLPVPTSWSFEKPFTFGFNLETNFYDSLSSSNPRSTTHHSWNNQTKAKYDSLRMYPAHTLVASNNISRLHNLILNLDQKSSDTKKDRYAHVKDNLGDIIQGADEVAAAAPEAPKPAAAASHAASHAQTSSSIPAGSRRENPRDRENRDTRESLRDTRDTTRDPRDTTRDDGYRGKDDRENRDTRDGRDTREDAYRKDNREVRDPREMRDGREGGQFRDQRDQRHEGGRKDEIPSKYSSSTSTIPSTLSARPDMSTLASKSASNLNPHGGGNEHGTKGSFVTGSASIRQTHSQSQASFTPSSQSQANQGPSALPRMPAKQPSAAPRPPVLIPDVGEDTKAMRSPAVSAHREYPHRDHHRDESHDSSRPHDNSSLTTSRMQFGREREREREREGETGGQHRDRNREYTTTSASSAAAGAASRYPSSSAPQHQDTRGGDRSTRGGRR